MTCGANIHFTICCMAGESVSFKTVQLADYLEAPVLPWQCRVWAAADPDRSGNARSVQQVLCSAREAGLHARACAALCDTHPALQGQSQHTVTQQLLQLPAPLHGAACRAVMQNAFQGSGQLGITLGSEQDAALCKVVRSVLQELPCLRMVMLMMEKAFVASAAAVQEAIALLDAVRQAPDAKISLVIGTDEGNADATWFIDHSMADSIMQILQAAAPALSALDLVQPSLFKASLHSTCDVCNAIRQMPQLERLQLRRGCARCCLQLPDTLCALTALQRLELPPTCEAAQLFEASKQLQHLTYLEMHLQVTEDAHGDMSHILSGLHALQHLELKVLGGSTEVLLDMLRGKGTFAGLQQLSALTTLRLMPRMHSNNEFTASGVAGSVAASQGLHTLRLVAAHMLYLGLFGGKKLLQENATTLKVVSLGRCGKSITEATAQCISTMTALTFLEISDRSNEAFECMLLAKNLAHIKALRSLTIRECSLDDIVAEALAAALPHHRQLTHLNLTCCGIRSGGAVCISKALQKLTALRRVQLPYNSFGDAGVRALVVRMAGLPQLQSVDLFCSGVSKALLHALRLQLPHVGWLQAM